MCTRIRTKALDAELLTLAASSNNAHASSSFKRGRCSKFAFGVSIATAPITTWKRFQEIMMSNYATPTQDIAYRSTKCIRPDSPYPRYAKTFCFGIQIYSRIEHNTSTFISGSKRITMSADQWVHRVACQCSLEGVSMKEHKN